MPARTKLLIPELPTTHVPRPALVRRVDDSVAAFAVTLVAGFAGSGKTVLLSESSRSRTAGTVAWLSCDVTDADPVQFWTALVGALRTLDPTIGVEALDLLDVDGDLGHDAIASLVNELCDLDGERVLVIDDLHLAARSVLVQLAQLLEQLPPHQRVVLSARSDPRLPLHRWRAAGRLGEIRSADLRMAPTEVGQLVNSVGVEVSAELAAVLADRTEGWAAGVQLAALSMRHERDPAQFIRTFAGGDRNVADFLVGEVLQRQGDDVVGFLLDTSVLDEFSAPLCDVLTERADSAMMLDRLERENLFVVALDNEQIGYRYHHLFAELLRRMLNARHPGRDLALHRTASAWYTDHDDPRRAVRHAILAEDAILVAGLLRQRTFTEFYTGTTDMLRAWISDLSRAHRDIPAELMLEYALALIMVGALDGARLCLAGVDTTLTDMPALFRARLALAHSMVLVLHGEIDPAIDAAKRARALVAPGVDATIDGSLQQVLLRSYVYLDDLTAARTLYERSLAQPDEPERLVRVVLAAAFSQAELEAGELEAARARAETAAADTESLGAAAHFASSEALRTLAALAYEHDHLDEAEHMLERCVEIVGTARPPFLLLTLIELARVWNARGDRDAAFAELDRARAALPSNARSPLIGRIDGYRARLLAEGGASGNAREVAAELPAGRRRSVVEARCDLAEKNSRGARLRLDDLASSNTTPRAALEYALLDARIALAESDSVLSAKLQRVLDLGRAAGFIRTLADEGHELAGALANEVRRQPADSYGDTLAPVLERAIAATPARNVALFGGVTLSERELTVLRYLATRLTTREIAAELYVSMNTFRSHTKSIYRKLGVESRAAAANAARALGIL